MQIRKLEPHESSLHRTLRLRALREAPDSFSETLPEAEARPLEYWEKLTRAVTRPGSQVMFLVLHKDVVCGMTYGLLDKDQKDTGRIGGMWVAEEWRRQGIGQMLLKAIFNWALDLQFTRLELWAPAQSAGAIALYRKVGFRETGNRRKMSEKPAFPIIEMMYEW